MNILFFNGILLAGLAALAVPLVLHFFLKGRVKRMRFSSLQFLMEDSQRQGFLHKLRNILLLLTRMMVIAILVFAFARPYREAASLSQNEGLVYMAFVLDTTASMQAGMETGEWQAIKKHILEEAASLSPADRTALLTCSSGNPVELGWSPPQTLIETVKAIEPGSQSSPLVRPLESALELFNRRESTRSKFILYVMSDFQDVALNRISQLPIPEDIELRLATMPQAARANVQAGIQTLDADGNGRCVVELKNMDGSPKNQLRTELFLNGRKAGEQSADLRPYQREWMEFSLPEIEPGRHKLRVKLAFDDDFDFDNFFYAVIHAEGKSQVICLNEEKGEGLEHPLFYIENAWDPMRQAGQPWSSPFAFQRMAPSLAAGHLNQHKDSAAGSIVVVPGLKHIPSGLGVALERHATRGGGIMFFAGEHGWPADYNTAFKDILPARFGRVVHAGESLGGPVRIRKLDRNHPALSPFQDPESGDLSSLLFRNWRELLPREGAEVVAEFDNGIPAILHRRMGGGHVVLINHTCGAEWSDWPKQRTFLPMIHGIGKFLANQDPEKPASFYFAGEPIRTVVPGNSDGSMQAMVRPDGERIQQRSDSSGKSAWHLDQAGFYEWQLPEIGNEWLAVNPSRDESSIVFLTVDRVERLIKRGETAPLIQSSFLGVPADKREFYRWLMALGLVLLLAELLISNRFAY